MIAKKRRAYHWSKSE